MTSTQLSYPIETASPPMGAEKIRRDGKWLRQLRALTPGTCFFVPNKGKTHMAYVRNTAERLGLTVTLVNEEREGVRGVAVYRTDEDL